MPNVLDSPLLNLEGTQVLVDETKNLVTNTINSLDSSISHENKKAISSFELENGKIKASSTQKITLADVALSGNASDVSITDSGDNFTATNVEDALEELAEGKGDNINFNESTSKLQLRSGNTLLDEVTIPGGSGVKIGDVTGATASVTAKEVSLIWSDPENVVVSGVVLARWGGTLVVRKAGSAPTSRTDGTTVVNNTTRNQYSSTPFVDDDSTLAYDTTYYYRFFPYTDGYDYTDGSSVSVTPTRIVITTVPSQSGTLTYDGTEKTPTWSGYDSDKMTILITPQTDAGTYQASFTPKEGYCWQGGSTSAQTVNWTIDKANLIKPEQSGSLTYDGTVQTCVWDSNYDNTKMTVSGNTGTNAGSYTATFAIIDSSNYQWSDGSVLDKTSTWSIGKATGSFTLGSNSVTLNSSTLSTNVSFTTVGDGVLSVQSSDTSVATATISGSNIVISSVNSTTGTATVTVSLSATTNYSAPANQTIAVTAQFVTIYGAQWDGSSTTAWSRTDASANFSDPSPAVNNGTGSSPFDNLMPWSGMVKVEDATAGTLVRIPKFWYKWTYSGSSMKLQIADGAVDGFLVSPAHADRGDGKGERDYVYVGRYHCATSTYKSTTGVKPANNYTRASFRSYIHNLGSDIWQYDFAMYWTICMLYLVEFADWNSQAKIGYGCGNGSAAENAGLTDAMQYHTGTNAASRTTYGHTQYRYIEDLWGNVYDWCDGIYFSSSSIYVIKNPSSFSDTSGGTYIGTRPTSSNYISAWNKPTTSGFEYALYPSVVNGTESTYVCDYCGYHSSGVVLRVGGNYVQSQGYGLFCLYGSVSASSKGSGVGSRLQKLP